LVGPSEDDVQLLGAVRIRELAAELNLRPTKQRGQNFVVDANTVRRIVALANVASDDVVLEVGPGLGSLTLGLLPKVQQVIAVEIDDVLAGVLPKTISEQAPTLVDRLQIINADALQVNSLDQEPTALVANLPYNVSVPVLLHLLATFESITKVLVMVQSEVADRLAAPSGSRVYGIPSVKARWFGNVTRVGSVGTKVFWPQPRVDSGLICITREPVLTTQASREEVFAVVDAAFAQRRKTLRSTLASWAGSRELVDEILLEAGVDPALRGEALNVLDFANIAVAKKRRMGT
jgi:16S rRNA (adenine1518-N6/adenine1519-N6)-dimethyltransferase